MTKGIFSLVDHSIANNLRRELRLAAMQSECQQSAGATLLTITAPNRQHRFFEFAYKSHLRLFIEVG